MNFQKGGKIIRQNFIFYLIGFLMIAGMKYFYSKAGSDELRWILGPTTQWVEILSGIPFQYEHGLGYVNHDFRFLIAPSCSGVQFMIITAATLIFSFVHRLEPAPCKANIPCAGGIIPVRILKGGCWVIISALLSYLFTIFVNGLRIIMAIYLPVYFNAIGIPGGFLSAEQLHTVIGIVVYFVSLLTIYQLFESFFRKITGKCSGNVWRRMVRKLMPPTFWYFFIVLGIPFLNRAYQKRNGEFVEFSILITVCCTAMLSLYCLIWGVRKIFKGR